MQLLCCRKKEKTGQNILDQLTTDNPTGQFRCRRPPVQWGELSSFSSRRRSPALLRPVCHVGLLSREGGGSPHLQAGVAILCSRRMNATRGSCSVLGGVTWRVDVR